MPGKGAGLPTRSTDNFPQDLTGGGPIGMRHMPPAKVGAGLPVRSSSVFPQDLTGGRHIGHRLSPPTTS